MKNEIIVINKEKGLTSRDVVNKLGKILNTRKIGHTGTLDPIASGVLVCLVGKYTKLANILMPMEKEYVAEIKLGIKTDTLDITGNVLEENKNININKEEIINVLNSFKGTYKQKVPIYSAVHINGKRLYEYARNKESVVLPEREVTVKGIEFLDYDNDLIRFRCVVSKGTYIRSLISDICDKLNVIGTMNNLIRTKQGAFTIEDSYSLSDIENNNYKSIALKDAIEVREIELDESLYKKVINGNKIKDDFNGYILFKKDNIEVALYYFEKNIGHLIILF